MKSKTTTTIHHHICKSSGKQSVRLVRILLALLLLLPALPAYTPLVPDRALAAPGDPVQGFGRNGIVLTDFSGGNDSAQAVAVNLQGKIIAAGSATIPGKGTDFALARYDENGNLDTTFGSGGKVITDFFSANDGVRGVAVQRDNKIVVSGFATNGAERQFALARYNDDGSLDTSFDQDGKVALDLGSTSEAFKLALQEDGKILAVGDSRLQTSLDFTIVRLNAADGSPDTTFGANGVMRVDFGNTDRAIDLAVSGNDLFVAGIVVKSATDSDFGIVRLNLSNGSLNNAFDGDGRVTLDFSGKVDGAQSIIIRQPIAPVTVPQIIVGGIANNTTDDFAIAAYDFTGRLIPALFNQGKDAIDFSGGRDLLFDLVDQPDGKLVGFGWAASGANFDLGMMKWNTDGRLVSNFGLQGKYTLDTASGGNNVAFAGMLYTDKIITAGTGINPITGNDDFVVTQHENEKFVEFTKTANPDPATEGDIVTYTLTIKNLTDKTLVLDVCDTLPKNVTFDSGSDPNWTRPPNVLYVLHEPITVGGSEIRRITLRLRANKSGILMNRAYVYTHPFREIIAEAFVESKVELPELTGVEKSGKNLKLYGNFGNAENLSEAATSEVHAVEPQAACPVVLFDGVEQKTSRDPENPSTVLIVKKGFKKLTPGQTVMVKVRLCNGAETAAFPYTRP